MSKKAKSTPVAAPTSNLTSLRKHPVAGPAIRKAKGAAGMLAFLATATLAFQNGMPFAAAMLRSLEVGIGANLAVWFGAVLIWKRILISQASNLARERRIAREAAAE